MGQATEQVAVSVYGTYIPDYSQHRGAGGGGGMCLLWTAFTFADYRLSFTV